MADLFLTEPGAVVAVDSPGIPVNFFLDNWGGYPGFKSIVTGIRVQTSSGVQYLHTLSDLVFVYVFGERMGSVTLSGVSFASQCERFGDQFFSSNHGLEYAMAYYLFNCVSSLGQPVTMVLGLSTPLVGFLDGATFELSDPAQVVGSWSLNFTAIPQPSPLDLFG